MCLRWNADDADGTDERRFKKGASPVTPSVVEGSHIRLNSALHEMSLLRSLRQINYHLPIHFIPNEQSGFGNLITKPW